MIWTNCNYFMFSFAE